MLLRLQCVYIAYLISFSIFYAIRSEEKVSELCIVLLEEESLGVLDDPFKTTLPLPT